MSEFVLWVVVALAVANTVSMYTVLRRIDGIERELASAEGQLRVLCTYYSELRKRLR